MRVAEFSDGGSSWTEPVITIVMIGLAVAWAIVLIPAILRSRREDEPVSTPPTPPEPSLEIGKVTLRWVFRYLGLSDDTPPTRRTGTGTGLAAGETRDGVPGHQGGGGSGDSRVEADGLINDASQ